MGRAVGAEIWRESVRRLIGTDQAQQGGSKTPDCHCVVLLMSPRYAGTGEDERHFEHLSVEEYPVVFLVGMEEQLMPSSLAIDKNEVEEERRLCYVGMTRAMQKLYLTYARSRFRWGERLDHVPSRFLDEIDESVVRRESTRRMRSATSHSATSRRSGSDGRARKPAKRKTSEYNQIVDETYSQLGDEIGVGSDVMHATFGRGRILGLQGNGEMIRAVVLFESVGKKTLVLKFAGLKPA